jgi:hypothetical protein
MIRKNSIETHSALMIKRDSERERFLEMLQQYNLEGKNEPSRFDAIKRRYEFANTQWEGHSGFRLKLLGEQARELFAIAESVIELNKKIIARLPDVVLAVRNEMEVPLDRDFYEAQGKEQTRKMDEAWIAAKERLKITFQSSAGTQPS